MQTRDHAAAAAAIMARPAQPASWLASAKTPLAIWALIVILPLAAFGLARFFHKQAAGAAPAGIARLESIAWPRTPGGARAAQPQPAGTGTAASVDSLVSGLERRLAEVPTDPKGWALLAQSYAFLGDAPKAEAALTRAVALGMDEADLRQRIALATGPQEAADSRNLSDSGVVIRGMVKLESARPLALPPESRLFVTAKATDGSTVPIAVLGQGVADFPYQFVLSDENAMMPGVKLSDFEEVALSARLSFAGTAQRNPGDLESAATIVHLGEPGPVDLVIENR